MRRVIPLVSKQKQVLYAHILSNALIGVEITKQTQTYVRSGNIGSIMNGMSRNTLRSMKTDSTQPIQL